MAKDMKLINYLGVNKDRNGLVYNILSSCSLLNITVNDFKKICEELDQKCDTPEEMIAVLENPNNNVKISIIGHRIYDNEEIGGTDPEKFYNAGKDPDSGEPEEPKDDDYEH